MATIALPRLSVPSLDVTRLKQQTIALERSALQLRRMHEIAKIIYWYHEVGSDGRRRRIPGLPDDFINMSGGEILFCGRKFWLRLFLYG